jgi:hypothetical protein
MPTPETSNPSTEGTLVERAKEMVAKATPGPWEAHGTTVSTSYPSERAGYEELGLHEEIARTHMTVGRFQQEAMNAVLIAAAPTLVTELCTALEKAEQQLGALRDYANHLMACAARNGRSCDCGLERLFIALAPSEQREG